MLEGMKRAGLPVELLSLSLVQLRDNVRQGTLNPGNDYYKQTDTGEC